MGPHVRTVSNNDPPDTIPFFRKWQGNNRVVTVPNSSLETAVCSGGHTDALSKGVQSCGQKVYMKAPAVPRQRVLRKGQ